MNTLTQHNLKAFEKAYDLAVKEKQEVFIFENQEILTNYAKYLLQYVHSIKLNKSCQ